MKRRNKTSPNSIMSATLKRDVGSALVAKRLVADCHLGGCTLRHARLGTEHRRGVFKREFSSGKGRAALSLAARMLLQVMPFYARRASIEKRVSSVRVARLP